MSSSIQLAKLTEKQGIVNKNSRPATIRIWNFFYPDLKKLFSMYKKIKERLKNMCKEQETKISQADLKINQTEY